MATYAQTPGLLNIKGVVGAHFSCQLDFDASLTGYTFDSAIVLQEYPTKREQAITVTVDNAAQGIITLSLTQGQTTTLGAIANKKWYLNWNISGIKQTILAGRFELSDIPLGQNIVTSTGITINTQDVDITLSAFSNAALDGKQPLNSALTQISALSPNDNDFLQRKSGAWTNRSIAQVKTDLAINNVDNTSDLNKPISTATQAALNLKLDASSASGTYQPLDSDLTAISAITPNDDDIIQRKSGAWTNRSIAQYKSDLTLDNVDNTSDSNKPLSNATISALSYKVNTNQISAFGYNLIDDSSASDARTTLELGTMAQQAANNVNITGGNVVLSNPINLASGGTGAILTPTNGGVVYSSATNFAVSSAGTSGQFLRSNGTGAPTWETPSATAGNATIFNDNSTNREFFPVFAYQSAGTATTLYGSSQKLKFNPSNGYFTAEGFVVKTGGVEYSALKSAGVYFNNNLVFDAEERRIYDGDGNDVAYWGDNNGAMYISGSASQDLPLRLIDDGANTLLTGAYIIVRPHSTDTLNGARLTNAYAQAKEFTPHGSVLSATNRATIILLPGRYNLGTARLNLDTDFVDIIGLTDTPEQVVITSSVILSDSGTIYQTANDVKIKGVTIDRTGNPAGSGAGRTAAYFPFPKATAITTWSGDGTTMTIAANGHGLQTGDSVRISGSGNSSVDGAFTVTRIDDNSFSYPSTVNAAGSIGTATERFNLTYIENCVFSGTSGSGMRIGMEYSGTYRRCVGGDYSFGGTLLGNPATTAIASGLFEDCTAGTESFGGGGTASGTFTRCTSSGSGFGGTASGTFTDCSSSINSFTFPSGIFVRCSVATSGFGSGFGGSATGTFTDCTINNSVYNGTFTGTARRCRFVASSGSALSVGNNAKLFDSTLVSSGVNNSITAGSAVTISLAGCRMNNSINANVSNNLGTLTESYNLIDSDIN
jgi:hypothetical protein